MDFYLAELVAPVPAWVFPAVADLSLRVEVFDVGTDTAETAEQWAQRFTHGKFRRRHIMVALEGSGAPGGGVPADPVPLLGIAQVNFPMVDNLTLADDALVAVDPAWRRCGIGSALASALRQLIESAGRSEVIACTSHRVPEAVPTLLPRTGHGAIPDDAHARFASHLGFDLELVERASVLSLPVSDEILTAALAAAATSGEDYELITWRDATPEPLLDGAAALAARMSTDAPQGDLAWTPQVWDAERVRNLDADKAATGPSWTTAVRHRNSGELVGLTEIAVPRDRPSVALQWNTIVEPAHRGHRLGTRLKAANLQAYQAEMPHPARLYTWNASENGAMLAINTRLGFRPAAVEGVWQRSL
ncbi:MAG: hypothetical protein WAV45_02610 [Propionibacteriaceae bacterium]|nr:GNAT family N-acetyltransferase [Micropruina sp.]HBX80956.1 GNAT family N-acetyltransferase [Propionibacteriaceae bacterium]HBY24462.1 GNAT family N-acetyltransferase [Propionibacteriaceae bacterium]